MLSTAMAARGRGFGYVAEIAEGPKKCCSRSPRGTEVLPKGPRSDHTGPVITIGETMVMMSAPGPLQQAAVPIDPIDTVGTGDAFVAGHLAERLASATMDTRLRTAVAVGAYLCRSTGDGEGLPRREELETLGRLEPVLR
jgi:hypothetical protein